MARCPHNNVQQFTEMCLDCGRNTYESDEEYYKYLEEKKNGSLSNKIESLEKELGIKHPGNERKACDKKRGTMQCSCGGYCWSW